SKQVYEMLAKEGLVAHMISAGARILEASCGPCIGMGGAPGSGHVSIRSYNRNFKGRSGTKDALVYLANPISCTIFALKGKIIDTTKFEDEIPIIVEPESFLINDNLIIPPIDVPSKVGIIKGPNIKEVPLKEPLSNEIEAEVLLKLSDNITTDDIMPAGSQILPLRSNIPAISEFVFKNIDDTFSQRAKEAKNRGGGIIVGGENYGQGSSREHAAIAPMYLGVQAVIAKSFARIHRANLVNFGIIPLIFLSEEDYVKIERGDRILISGLSENISGNQRYMVKNKTKGYSFEVFSNLNEKEKELILKGGLLPYIKEKQSL
ncbi:MAG: aconitase family protein, partial [Thermodesulfovibrionales bacterium]|nr:aconitase family protein [Thermodesulfovibrionales bacterium]